MAAGEIVLCFSVRPSEPERERERDTSSGKYAALFFCDFTHVKNGKDTASGVSHADSSSACDCTYLVYYK